MTLTQPVVFPGEARPSRAEVGGKGHSLMRMAAAGLRVPPGFVLPVGFFAPWLDALATTDAWRRFQAAPEDRLAATCEAVESEAAGFRFDDAQRQALDAALVDVASATLFAVRSSSPEEDLEGSSFAGGYETVLGVSLDGLEDAVRRAFASCLNARIAIYKQQHGFDARSPSIAVVVQRQVASGIAGVGFSLNPINGCYDEAIVNANWGLGETVVAGIASPDLYVIDKVKGAVMTREVGAKETSIWLTGKGGTETRPDPRHDALTLSDAQLIEILEQLTIIEALYDKPMDIEWAYAQGTLYLLQARPITTHFSMPEALVTAPGDKKRLYLDLTISVQGLYEPISVMGTSVLQRLACISSNEMFGRDITGDIDTTIPVVDTGRLYLNLSNLLALTGKSAIAGFLGNLDTLAASAIEAIDEDTYRAADFSKSGLALGALNMAPPRLMSLVEGRLLPDSALRGCQSAIAEFTQEVRAMESSQLHLPEYIDRLLQKTTELVCRETIPLMALSRRAISEIKALFAEPDDTQAAHLERFDRSLPGNVTVEMGLALYALSRRLPADAPSTADALRDAIDSEAIDPAFLHAWSDFIAEYGHRGLREIDICEPRYREDPSILLAQILALAEQGEHPGSPMALFERSQVERQEAFLALGDDVRQTHGWLQMQRYQSLYRVMEALGGLRETHKYYVVYAIDRIRTRLLSDASRLLEAGRLDRVEQIFDLTIDDVVEAFADEGLDLRTRAAQRRAPIDRLAHVPVLPTVFDSRGRIFRPPTPPSKPGELAGQPISAGVVRGRVNVLQRPDEKPLAAGEILVARATDPGWTPLFVNAAAIVLEVGGMLQHGALVAREYGKPCVAGIQDATSRLKDGELVEVDGSAGVVRRIDADG